LFQFISQKQHELVNVGLFVKMKNKTQTI